MGAGNLADVRRVGADAEVYPPDEDSFLLADALSAELPRLLGAPGRLPPRAVLEVGCGSGYVGASATRLLGAAAGGGGSAPAPPLVALDVNPNALAATRETLAAHGLSGELVRADLLAGLRRGIFDLVLFNPPYVPTPSDELEQAAEERGLAAAWAGGERGRVVIDRFLDQLGGSDEGTSPPRSASAQTSACFLAERGCCLMIALAQNDPEGILDGLGARGLQGRVIERRRADEEFLCVLKMWRAGESEYGDCGTAGSAESAGVCGVELGPEAGPRRGGVEGAGARAEAVGAREVGAPAELTPAARALATLAELYDVEEGLGREDFKRTTRAYIDSAVPEGAPFRDFVYGEVGFMALRKFLQAHTRRPSGRDEWVFYDLGSGAGVQVLAAALLQPAFTRLVGVEIIPGLVEASKRARSLWLESPQDPSEPPRPEIQFECADILEHEGVADADVVLINSTCFGPRLVAALEALLAERLRCGAVVMALSHELRGPAWELLEERSGKMSWGHAAVRAYRRTGAPACP